MTGRTRIIAGLTLAAALLGVSVLALVLVCWLWPQYAVTVALVISLPNALIMAGVWWWLGIERKIYAEVWEWLRH